MAKWSETTTVYKVGTAGVLVSVCLYVIGFGSPFWFKSQDIVIGLWQMCSTSLESCSKISFGITGYFDALRVIQILGLIAMLIGVILVVVVNILSTETSAALVVASFVTGGILGCVGDAMYGISGIILQSLLGSTYASLSWSFALNIIGSVLAIIFGILVAVSMKSHGTRGVIVHPVPGQQQMQVFQTSVPQTNIVNTGQQQAAYGQMQSGYIQQQAEYGQMQSGYVQQQPHVQIQRPPAYTQTQVFSVTQQVPIATASAPPSSENQQPPGYQTEKA